MLMYCVPLLRQAIFTAIYQSFLPVFVEWKELRETDPAFSPTLWQYVMEGIESTAPSGAREGLARVVPTIVDQRLQALKDASIGAELHQTQEGVLREIGHLAACWGWPTRGADRFDAWAFLCPAP